MYAPANENIKLMEFNRIFNVYERFDFIQKEMLIRPNGESLIDQKNLNQNDWPVALNGTIYNGKLQICF